MNHRHPNRLRSTLRADRIDGNREKAIDTFEVPTIKIGRFVNFGASAEFSEYFSGLEEKEGNKQGLEKGWFSFVDAPLFVEYADLTIGLRKMLEERSRPRSFGREIMKTTTTMRKSIQDFSRVRLSEVMMVNEHRSEALRTAVEQDDHAELFEEYSYMFQDSSEWDAGNHLLHPQPKAAPTSYGAVMTFGFAVASSVAEASVKDQISDIIRSQKMPVPERLLKDQRPIVPVVDLHVEMSTMKRNAPVLDRVPPQIALGPIEIHRF